MGIERLKTLVNIDTAIMTRENTDIVKSRAEKLKITKLYMGVHEKEKVLNDILEQNNLKPEEIAYMGDDTNDVEIMKMVGLSACPNDATKFAKKRCRSYC